MTDLFEPGRVYKCVQYICVLCCLVYEHMFIQYLEIFLFCYLFFVVPLLVSKRTVRNLRYVCTCVWNVRTYDMNTQSLYCML